MRMSSPTSVTPCMDHLVDLDLDDEGLTPEEIKKRKTKIFVGGLKYSSQDDVLVEYFAQFGDIEEAVVIHDRETGLSKGYGFVTMVSPEGAALAIQEKSPRIDGRRCNVDLAYIGQKKKISAGGKKNSLTLQGIPSPHNGYPGKPYMNGSPFLTPSPQPVFQVGLPIMNGQQAIYVPPPTPPGPYYEARDPASFNQWVLAQQLMMSNQLTSSGSSTSTYPNNNYIPAYTHVTFFNQYPYVVDSGQAQISSVGACPSPFPPSPVHSPVPQVIHYQQQREA